MTSAPERGASPLSLRNGFRCAPESGATIEDVLLAVADQIGHENINSASRMNKAVVVFLKNEHLVKTMIENGIWVKETYVPVTPLSAPATKVTVSNVPPFISSDSIVKELSRFGKIAGGVKMIPLGCKNASLKHVLSFRRQLYMFLTSPDKTLDVSFRVSHGDSSYMLYASTDSLRCFECGDIGHKRFVCPHKQRAEENQGPRTDEQQTVATKGSVQAETVKVINTEVSEAVNVVNDSQMPSVSGVSVQQSTDGANAEEALSKRCVESSDDEVDGQSEVTEGSIRDDESCFDVDMDKAYEGELYTVEQINNFLDETKGKSVELAEFFPDLNKFVDSVIKIRSECSNEVLSQQKRFRLKKHITAIRQSSKKVRNKRSKLK